MTSSNFFNLRSDKPVSISSPKSNYSNKRRLRYFDSCEVDILSQWSLLPNLFADWDLDGNGSIDKQELLYGIDTFCQINRVVFNGLCRQNILDRVDSNHDGVFDKEEFTKFLIEFSRTVNVSLFDVVYFMMEFLEEREEWDHNYEVLCNGGSTMSEKMVHFLSSMRTNLAEEVCNKNECKKT
eukprot:CAMPEP_0116849646 /NCGR_PEP_ID=MMETSP0418-20121206/15694_1 /TAXON_ID=1158023 /ORGANISM="Astrosyne radiata, Strain 13vi08-1A" /LENGTH=181 /DNA_ID=CAMNT_0004481403 /DNA_START=30 /DNA_END=575 /DNA_ORIENTATION=+